MFKLSDRKKEEKLTAKRQTVISAESLMPEIEQRKRKIFNIFF